MKNVIFAVLVLVFTLLYFSFTNFIPVTVVENNSYAITGNEIAKNLFKEKIEKDKSDVKAVSIDAFDSLYKGKGKLYVGEEKKVSINNIYPLFTNDSLAVVNLSSDSKLIDKDFNIYDTYEYFTLTSGILYNKDDNTRADNNEYLFLQLSNRLLINSKPFTVITNEKEYKIPIDSIISFTEETINYYSFNGDILEYYKIEDIDMKSNIKFDSFEDTYENILINLGIISPKDNDIPDIDVPDDNNNEEIPYQKPIVKCDQFTTNVYSAQSRLYINDPSGAINSPVIFELKMNDKLYARKAYVNSGAFEIRGLAPSTRFEIVGYFTYINELGKEIKENVIKQTFTTKGIEDLTPITLSFNNGNIYSNKIELTNFKIADGLNSETIKGVKKINILLNGEVYRLSSSDFSSLLKGNEITYVSPEKLQSNSRIDYEILFYDNYNNVLQVLKNTGSTRTSKETPTASIKVENSDTTGVNLRSILQNKDNVEIKNYKYIVYTPDSKIVTQGSIPSDGLIKLYNLNSDELFSINIYGDFDTDDGNGTKTNQLIGETKFTSVPITSLGYIRLDLEMENILQTTAKIKMKVNTTSTDSRLLALLESLKINIVKKTETSEDVVFTSTITGEDIENLKLDNTLIQDINSLSSSTEYYIYVESTIIHGSKEYVLDTLINIKSFKTMKKEAEVLVQNMFTTESMIDFDVKIVDEDDAILSDGITLEVRDSAGKIVKVEKLNKNQDYVRLTYNKLNPLTNYTFNYIVSEYNIGHDNSTFYDNYTISTYRVFTEEGIKGNVGIVSLLEKQIGKNLFNINNPVNWKYNGTGGNEKSISLANNSINLTALNGWSNYSYYLIDYASKKLTISFYAKRIEGNAPVYIANSDGNVASYTLSNLDSTWKKYTYTFTLNTYGYIGINVREVDGGNLRTTISIKDLQIEESSTATTYEQFISSAAYDGTISVDLNDSRDEITTNDYYIKLYKESNLVTTYKYDINETNIVSNSLHAYNIDKNANYDIDLVIKIRDRDYVISRTSFTTEKEIRSIKTISDLFKMHNNGKYIVLNDLDFRNTTSAYSSVFYGNIDFQGHSVYMSAKTGASYLFHTIASTGIVMNVDLRIYLDNTIEKSYWYGLNYTNNGKIQNIMVTLEEATAFPNITMCTISYSNNGTIENFVINSKVSMYGERYFSLGVIHNYGTMRNGYVYGETMKATFNNLTTNTKRVGTIAAYTGGNSKIENVFSLVTIETPLEGSYNKQYGIIVGESNRGLIENVYSVGELINPNASGDPNVGYVSSMVNPTNLFYISKNIYNAKYSQKVSSIALHDSDFQNKALNSANGFVIDGLVDNGYYPQINMPDCMPYQELISLPIVEDVDLMDITSTEVLESNVSSAQILLNIHNPSGETITNIALKDASIRILSQTYDSGKSKVTAIIENPIKFLSKYYVKSITSVGAYNIAYTRTYEDNERNLYIDLYREVTSIDDWKKIKESPSENYGLVADLDFMYATDFLVGNFSGKFNGNGHTIKNIEVTSGSGLFTTLNGEIKNLNVLNYKKMNASSYGGLIYNSNNTSTIDNVHMKNAYINATSFMGGIIGYSSGTIIRNSSVTNFNNINAEEMWDIRIGGIVGYSTGGYIQNSYAQDVNIDVSDSISTYGIGGIIGQIDSGVIENCYSTGNIKTNSSYTGGIAGLSAANISNVYSNVNIESEMDYVGGIVGRATNNYLYNSLVFGNVYSSYITTYMHRSIGNTAPNQNNYALSSQLIDGYTSELVYGEILINRNELLDANTYKNIIQLGNSFDYSGSSSGYLPKLYNTDGVTLLPNQNNKQIPDEDFDIISVDSAKRLTDATILISINNSNNLQITGITFDYFNITNVNKMVTQNGITTIEVIVTPNKYLDTYKLTNINYIENGVSKSYKKATKIALQFYKNLGSFEDWQRIDSSVPENYRLVSDIDFQGKLNINTNIIIARLEGIDNGYTLKNLTLTLNQDAQAIFKKVTKSIKNVNFNNISITNTRTSGNYNNIVRINYGDIDNVDFTNITINASKMNYSTIIGVNRGYFISNILLDNINSTGLDYTSGFIGNTLSNAINDITASNITVVGRAYVGGIIGSKPYDANTSFYRFNVTNANVTGSSTYVGGIFGLGSADDSSITGSTIKGASYVGGISGNAYFLYTRRVTVTNCNISGTSSYVGGAYGYSYYLYDAFVFDSVIEGLSSSANYIGGIAGSTGYSIYNSGILNSTINSLGKYTGGILGYQTGTLAYSYIYNTSVTGVSNVGGVIGRILTGTVACINVNADVVATASNAGGVFGYVENTTATNVTNPIRMYSVIITNGSITAANNAGGLIGYAEVPLYSGHFYNSIVVTTINTTNEFGIASATVGNNKDYASLISNLIVYDKMKINNQVITSIENNGLNASNYVTLANLKTQTTYTAKGFSTARFDFPSLSSNKFPLVKASTGVIVSNEVAVDLPTELQTFNLRLNSFELHNLPTYNIYSVDVDKINIEFNTIDEYTTFELKSNDKLVGRYNINNRVYTFQYNFNTPFEITISDGINDISQIFNPEDIRKLISVYNNKYYYIKGSTIKNNGEDIKGDFLNIYLDKAIDKDGNIYELPSTTKIDTIDNNIKLLDKVTPLFNFEYEDYFINTYYNFSEITSEENIIHDYQLILKNGKLEMIDSLLPAKKDCIIIDSYGKYSYESILGEDGKLYNLKATLKVPNDFKNSDIKYITNNILDNSGFVLVQYNDGSLYGFDYRTGARLFTDMKRLDISLGEYIKQKLTVTKKIVDDNTYKSYEDSKELEEKLYKDPIEKILDNNTSSNIKKSYVSKYDSIKEEFVLYDESELLKSKDTVKTVNDKINSNIELIEFYSGKKFNTSTASINGLIILEVIVGLILTALVIALKYIKPIKNKKKVNI